MIASYLHQNIVQNMEVICLRVRVARRRAEAAKWELKAGPGASQAENGGLHRTWQGAVRRIMVLCCAGMISIGTPGIASIPNGIVST